MKNLSLTVTAFLLIAFAMFSSACKQNPTTTVNTYHDTTGRKDILSGGVQLIPIQTEKGVFNVWTKRVGNNPKD